MNSPLITQKSTEDIPVRLGIIDCGNMYHLTELGTGRMIGTCFSAYKAYPGLTKEAPVNYSPVMVWQLQFSIGSMVGLSGEFLTKENSFDYVRAVLKVELEITELAKHSSELH